jgi:ribosomal protein S12 methylthiotransferase accessory factor
LWSALSNPFTGLLKLHGELPLRPGDPDMFIHAGSLPRWFPDGRELAVGGCGFDAESARAATIGEGLERLQAHRLPTDDVILSSEANWKAPEPPIALSRWVLFHPEQYATPNFPYHPPSGSLQIPWVTARVAETGEAVRVPTAFAFLQDTSQLCPTLSTGLAAGRIGDPVLLRGLQEVIERDALVGAWWGSYGLQEESFDELRRTVTAEVFPRIERPNLLYRFFRIDTPYSAHVCLVTLSGEDHSGWNFAVGSACREHRGAAWTKAILEAIQSRHYVRYLLEHPEAATFVNHFPADFAAHAVYYSHHREKLAQTMFANIKSSHDPDAHRQETLPQLRERLGSEHPVLFRLMTPPAIAESRTGWLVMRVMVPGLQPLHGQHLLPFLGGKRWAPRGLRHYATILPHPFP